jgi:hypothetical protein
MTAPRRLKVPADFATRRLPTYLLDCAVTPLWRIHRSAHGAIWFNRPGVSGTRFRFDAPADEFGVLYASPDFSVCMAEAMIRDRFADSGSPLELELAEVRKRSITAVGPRRRSVLTLANLTEDLFVLGADASLATSSDYADANLWALAIHEHPQHVDGIAYCSRYTSGIATAIFERVDMEVKTPPTELEKSAELGPFLNRYAIALL